MEIVAERGTELLNHPTDDAQSLDRVLQAYKVAITNLSVMGPTQEITDDVQIISLYPRRSDEGAFTEV